MDAMRSFHVVTLVAESSSCCFSAKAPIAASILFVVTTTTDALLGKSSLRVSGAAITTYSPLPVAEPPASCIADMAVGCLILHSHLSAAYISRHRFLEFVCSRREFHFRLNLAELKGGPGRFSR